MGSTDRRWLWRWRRGPLRRRWDVLDAWLGLLTAVALVLAVPAAGTITAFAAHGSLAAKAEEQNRHRHQVRAVLLESAPHTPPAVDFGSAQAGYEAKVRWTGPDGTVHTEQAAVSAGQRKGSWTTVWTDDRGERTRPPITGPEILSDSVAAGLTAAVMFALSLVGVRWALRRRLDRRRMADWDRAWAEVGPRWGHEHT